MKKVISVLMCSVLIFLSFSVISFADNGEKSFSFEFIEEFFGKVVSVVARGINNITGMDEADIEKAEIKEKSYKNVSLDFVIEDCENEIDAQVWVMNEITFESEKSYNDCFNNVVLDMELIGNGRKYTVPGFWNGGNEWKIRFVCPSAGVWYYKTICSDTENTELNGRTGKIICKEYSGDYDIYKNGFVTTDYGKKYFTYDNGTRFLYLGDTHWSLGDETTEMVKTICEKRSEQGFTVIQSEPIGAKFNVADGVSECDMAGFADYDKKFKIIADNGLVHANAEFFFPGDMDVLINNFGGYGSEYTEIKIDGKKVKLYDISDSVKQYLEKLTRYWVARYGAYPVMWTLGQEVDNDFYWRIDNHSGWSYINNPYKLIAEYIDKYDCYDHPISAHQEHTGATSAYGSGNNTDEKYKVYNKSASSSAFRDVTAHNWYAVQWNPSKTSQFDNNIPKDYWYNSQGKPSINYEGAYCGLWTKNFGSRMQGWCAYLSGLYGYGWGGHDTWSYTNIYDEENDSSDGVDVITSKEKKDATWLTSLNYESSYQCGYMLDFLSEIQWYNLIPRFDNKAYFVPLKNVYYAYASNNDNSEIVIYFYNFNDNSLALKTNSSVKGGISTGTVGNLERNTEYSYKWFNPVTNEYSQESVFVSSSVGTYFIGEKNNTDMVLYICKK